MNDIMLVHDILRIIYRACSDEPVRAHHKLYITIYVHMYIFMYYTVSALSLVYELYRCHIYCGACIVLYLRAQQIEGCARCELRCDRRMSYYCAVQVLVQAPCCDKDNNRNHGIHLPLDCWRRAAAVVTITGYPYYRTLDIITKFENNK